MNTPSATAPMKKTTEKVWFTRAMSAEAISRAEMIIAAPTRFAVERINRSNPSSSVGAMPIFSEPAISL